MAKQSQINRNKKRVKMAAQYAPRRAALKAKADDMSVAPEERFAARLKLAKSFIVANSHRRDISITNVAAKLNVTPRYVQRLFEADGTTFSDFLTRFRLSRAHRLLCAPASSHDAIATIAYDVGFGDLSYFNRRFRRQYGLTPREVLGDRGR